MSFNPITGRALLSCKKVEHNSGLTVDKGHWSGCDVLVQGYQPSVSLLMSRLHHEMFTVGLKNTILFITTCEHYEYCIFILCTVYQSITLLLRQFICFINRMFAFNATTGSWLIVYYLICLWNKLDIFQRYSLQIWMYIFITNPSAVLLMLSTGCKLV